MKCLLLLPLLCGLALALSAQDLPVPTAGQSTAKPREFTSRTRGPHHTVWESLSLTTNSIGEISVQTNSYTELATGLNYRDPRTGNWTPSTTEIEPLQDGSGAVARKGQHQAFFPANIYSGAIELVTPDGTKLRSRPLGLSYCDGSNSVLIAELTNSVCQILPSRNKVIWTNCFTDFAADLVAEYRKGGFVCSVVFRERPPGPETWDLPASSRLQLLTEFFDTNDPVRIPREFNNADGLRDTTLKFGTNLMMVPGTAFALGNETNQNVRMRRDKVPVYKSWQHLPDSQNPGILRRFLIEEVPYQRIKDRLSELAAVTAPTKVLAAAQRARDRSGASRKLPPRHPITTGSAGVLMAKADISTTKGYVLDYETVNTGGGDYTFRGDTTYLVSDLLYFGSVTMEGGTVIKFPETGLTTICPSDFVFETSAYRPAILTSVNDDTVGEVISGSSGSPLPGQNVYLTGSTGVNLNHAHIRFAGIGAYTDLGPSDAWNSQFVSCGTGITSIEPSAHNVLFANCDIAINDAGWSGTARTLEHITADNCGVLIYGGSELLSYSIKNTILRGVGAVHQGWGWGDPSISTEQLVSLGSGAAAFQTVGAGSYYLAPDSLYRNAGTTNISADLQTALHSLTTHPPTIRSNVTVAVDTTLTPVASRDTDIPDLGYHYAPIDYIAYAYSFTNCTLTISPGTVIAYYDAAGLWMKDGATILSEGTPLSPVRFADHHTVQEQPIKFAYGSVLPVHPYRNNGDARPARFRFTEFTRMAPAGTVYNFYIIGGNWKFSELTLRDCALYNGVLSLSPAASVTVNFDNNLFHRAVTYVSDYDSANSVSFRNNLFYGGAFNYDCEGDPVPTIKDNIFQTTSIAGESYPDLDHGYNAYLNGSGRIYPTNANDVVLSTFTLASGPLGNFYQASTNLFNKGSRTADLAGLYHYTVFTNQVKETNSTVDIGFHYVAVSGAAAIDTDGDGIPDYLEDTNGNGSADSGETNWQNSENGTTGSPGLQVFNRLF